MLSRAPGGNLFHRRPGSCHSQVGHTPSLSSLSCMAAHTVSFQGVYTIRAGAGIRGLKGRNMPFEYAETGVEW